MINIAAFKIPARLLAAQFARLLVLAVQLTVFTAWMTADASAYDSRDLGCDQMSTAGFILAHLVSLIAILGGGIIALANDCGPLGWVYWLLAAPGLACMILITVFPLVVSLTLAINALFGGGSSTRSPLIVGAISIPLALSMASPIQAAEWTNDIRKMEESIREAVQPYNARPGGKVIISIVIADAGVTMCWGSAQVSPGRKISHAAIDTVRAFYGGTAKGQMDLNKSIDVMTACVRESIATLEAKKFPRHRIKTLVFGSVDQSISRWRTQQFWISTGLRLADMAK